MHRLTDEHPRLLSLERLGQTDRFDGVPVALGPGLDDFVFHLPDALDLHLTPLEEIGNHGQIKAEARSVQAALGGLTGRVLLGVGSVQLEAKNREARLFTVSVRT